MLDLYSYIITHDTGAAPNPFGGVCTLAICKPGIRKAATVGDWVVGIASSTSPLAGRVVYAMRVTAKMTMPKYDQYTQAHLPSKLPLWTSPNPTERAGDSIYDFSTQSPTMRPGVHGEEKRRDDLSGLYVLLSEYFFYFGDQARPLPPELLPITEVGRGFLSNANARHVRGFLTWLQSLGLEPNRLYGRPAHEQLLGCSGEVEDVNCSVGQSGRHLDLPEEAPAPDCSKPPRINC